jgi:hypothetical protein
MSFKKILRLKKGVDNLDWLYIGGAVISRFSFSRHFIVSFSKLKI